MFLLEQPANEIETWDEWVYTVERYLENVARLNQRRPEDEPAARAILTEIAETDHRNIMAYLAENRGLGETLQEIMAMAAPGMPTLADALSTVTGGSESGGSSDDLSWNDDDNACASGRGSGSDNPYASSSTARVSSSSGTAASEDGLYATLSLEAPKAADLPRASWETERRPPPQTLAVYDVPASYTQEDLLNVWPPDGSYDFLHLRFTFADVPPRRTVIINFPHPEVALDFQRRWNHQLLHGGLTPQKPIHVTEAPIQGRDANLMAVMDSAPVAPVLLLGQERLGPRAVQQMIQAAKRGVFLCRA